MRRAFTATLVLLALSVPAHAGMEDDPLLYYNELASSMLIIKRSSFGGIA